MEDARKQQEQKRSYSPAQSDQTTRACTLRLNRQSLTMTCQFPVRTAFSATL